jgi:hypothetical protein
MEFWKDILKEALGDSLPALPILFLLYGLIEWIETKKYADFEHSSLLHGKWSPIFGAFIGSIPQCGFSVAATDLYVQGELSMGALVAVYLATSDEALPILLSHPENYGEMIGLIAIKWLIAGMAGMLTSVFFTKRRTLEQTKHESPLGCCSHEVVHEEEEKLPFEWKHPLIHSLKIFAYIFAVNFLMSALIQWIGPEVLTNFLGQSRYLQPLLAALIGMIPNCAASVVMTELYLLNGLSFGALVTGLSVNAGLGLLVLYKENRNIQENFLITAIVTVSALLAGYLLLLIL